MQTQRKTGPRSMPTSPHSVRCTESLWLSASRRAASDGVKINYAVNELLEGYGRGLLSVPPSGSLGKSTARTGASHSIRTPDNIWAAAQRRAASESRTMNDVVVAIMEGYSRGLMDLPRVTKQYVRKKAS